MTTQDFIVLFQEAFGKKVQLPLLFGYSDKPIADTEKIGGCFFKGLQAAREGTPVSLSAEVIGCGGGKLYTGFSDMPERVPGFVSLKEKYKKTPEMVTDYVNSLGMKRATKPCLNFISHVWLGLQFGSVNDIDCAWENDMSHFYSSINLR